MSLTITATSPDTGNWLDIPEDVYEVRFVSRGEVLEVPAYEDPNRLVNRVRLDFEIVNHQPEAGEPNLTGQRIGEFFTVSLHEKSKLAPFVRAMLGRDIEPGENVDLDDYVGNVIRGTVRMKAPNKNGIRFPEIVNPMPARSRRKAASARQEVDPDEAPF